MSYVENNLLKDEEIVYKAKIHWAIYLPAAVWGLLAIIFTIDYFANNAEGILVLMLIMWAVTAFCVIKGLIETRYSEYVLTNKRLIMKTGIIARKTEELMLTKCEGVFVDQSILGRLFGYGTLLATTGGATNKFRKIADPIIFRNRINEQTDIVHSSNVVK